jgi:hypothetical protein
MRVALHVLEAVRLPELYREVCLHAGIPLPPAPPSADRFALRAGAEPTGLFAGLLEEALAEDGAEVVLGRDEAPDFAALGPGGVVVLPGTGPACPDPEALRQAACPGGGAALVFAIERRDAAGRLLGVTWAAVPEDEPPPETPFRAAVVRLDEEP